MNANRWEKSKYQADDVLIMMLCGVLLFFLFTSWILMLLLGALHHEVAAGIPAPSYAGTILLQATYGLLATIWKNTGTVSVTTKP